MTGSHDHARPGIADQLATLAAARGLLATADLGAAHQAAEAAIGEDSPRPCPACATVAATSFGIALAEQLAAALVRKLAPGAEFDAGPIRAQLLVMVAEAERELRSAGN